MQLFWFFDASNGCKTIQITIMKSSILSALRLLSLSVFVLLCFSASLNAMDLSGRVVDQRTGQPIAYTTISLLQTDSTLVTGAITNDEGEYTLTLVPVGTYILSASFVGYRTVYQNVTKNAKSVINFSLSEETELLNEVEIKAKKPLIERQMDKLIMNVSASPFALGSNGKDVLSKAPGVRIDTDGNITVNGKSVEVYIDGRPSYLSGEQLKGLLQGTSGSTIEKIEIITNPSAKYDASGQGGIINIKLKRNMMQGFNGMLAANYGGMYFKQPHRYFQNDYVNLSLNYRSANTYTSASLTQVYANQGVAFQSYSEQPMGEEQMRQVANLDYNVDFQYYMARVTHDWYIDSVNTFGLILNVPVMSFGTKATSPASEPTYTQVGQTYLCQTMTEGGAKNYSPQHSANVNFTHVFADSCSQELTANFDYNRFNSTNRNFQQNKDIEAVPAFASLPALDINTYQVVNIYSAKLDFQSGFLKNGFVETGAKWALSNTDNLMNTDSTFMGGQTSRTTNAFVYNEHVAALYASVAWRFNEHWNIKGGLRGEYTYGLGDWKQEGIDNYKNSRIDFFPTAFIGYNPTEDWHLSASYTRRIKRPSYWQLNPFRSYYSNHAFQEGNPELQPEFNNQVDLSFGWSQYVTLAGNFAHTQEMMHQKGEVLPNGDIRSAWINFGTCTTHGVNLGLTEVPIVPKKNEEGEIEGAWLALTLNVGYFNFISRSKDNSFVQRTHFGNGNASLTAYLPKDIQIAVDGWYSAPMTIGYTYYGQQGAMNFAFKKTFPKQQLTLALTVNDLLRTSKFGQEDKGVGEGYVSRVSQEVYQQNISIGITYMFGQQQHHKWRKVGQSDESSRLGSSGGVGK